MEAKLIAGNCHKDNRGTLRFFNDFHISPIKRFYTVEHYDKNIVRAWQGHQKEQKWFYVIEGSFRLVLVEPDDWTNPLAVLTFQEFTLNAVDNKVINIPSGIATGFQSLQESSKMIIFSDVTLEQSINDDFRFDKDLWYKWW